MSTAAKVPDTSGRYGDRAWTTLVEAGRRRLIIDSFVRLRVADGFSHARSLAFMVSVVAVQGLVTVVGLASAVGHDAVGVAAEEVTRTVAPGPVGGALVAAIDEARATGGSERYLAIAIGLVGALVSGTTAMGQLQRSFNRIYGLEQDRPPREKYGRALLLALTAGTLMTAAFAAIAFGRAIGESIGDNIFTPVWGVARFPLAFVVLVVAFGVLLQVCPSRRQPSWPWLAPGAFVGVAGWVVVTVGLAEALALSSSFGDTYGPLAGVVALLLWSLLSSIAVLFGAALSAELEAVRAGRPEPQRNEAGQDTRLQAHA